MSEENIELVRRAYESISATRRLDPALFDKDFEWDVSRMGAAASSIHGRAAAEPPLRDYWETFEEFGAELEELIHADQTQVVTVGRDGGRIRGVGRDLWQHYFHVWAVNEGRITGLSVHPDRASALKAAGLAK